jgi:hypothetical protein
MRMAKTRRASIAAIIIAMGTACCGCISPAAVNPPIVTVTPMGAAMLPAKPANCAMPVLDSMPLAVNHQIALVDVWGDLAAKNQDLLEVLKREACQAGADAVVLNSTHLQHEGDLRIGAAPGRYGNIGPGSEASIEQGAHIGIDPEGGGKKHHAVVGEEGHPGRYLSGIAIVYSKGGSGSGTASSGDQ